MLIIFMIAGFIAYSLTKSPYESFEDGHLSGWIFWPLALLFWIPFGFFGILITQGSWSETSDIQKTAFMIFIAVGYIHHVNDKRMNSLRDGQVNLEKRLNLLQQARNVIE